MSLTLDTTFNFDTMASPFAYLTRLPMRAIPVKSQFHGFTLAAFLVRWSIDYRSTNPNTCNLYESFLTIGHAKNICSQAGESLESQEEIVEGIKLELRKILWLLTLS